MQDWRELSSKLATLKTPDEVRALFLSWRGGHGELFTTVARYTPVWDESLFLTLWAGCEGSEDILDNRHRTPAINEALARWEANRLNTGTSTRTQKATEALQHLAAEESISLDSEVMQEIEQTLLAGPKRKSLTEAQDTSLRILCAHPSLPSTSIRRYYEDLRTRLSASSKIRLAGHRNAEREIRSDLFYLALNKEATGALYSEAVRFPAIVGDSEFRATLVHDVRERKHWYAARELMLATPEDEERGSLLLTMLENEPRGTFIFIRNNAKELLPRLPNEVLQKLLSSSNAEIRLLAISSLGAKEQSRAPDKASGISRGTR